LVSLIFAIQATGLLAITLEGLSPTEHISLIWTHIQTLLPRNHHIISAN